jgi:hypothetical protein
MLNPTIAARVAELEGVGMLRGDAIGVAAAEQHQRANPPRWLQNLDQPLVEPGTRPEGEPR